VLGMDQPLLGLPGLGQPLLIHLAHTSQMLKGLAERLRWSATRHLRGQRRIAS
jgi:hypothetical protein